MYTNINTDRHIPHPTIPNTRHTDLIAGIGESVHVWPVVVIVNNVQLISQSDKR